MPSTGNRTQDPTRVAFGFIVLMASLGAVNAFTTDIVMPALGEIAESFRLTDANDRQWVILAVFVGMVPSQLMIGPLSDAIGRRRSVALAIGVFGLGTLLTLFAPDFEWHLAGRALQGFGSGGLRIVSMAITRDLYAGRAMAQVVSLSSSIFILIILFAPLTGQAILELAGWRMIHVALLAIALGVATWFALSQPETLRPEQRRRLSAGSLSSAAWEALRHPATLGCTVALGAVLGGFIAYLSSAQQIYGGIYGLGRMFPVVFGAMSLVYGGMSLVNAWLVARFGITPVVRAGLALTIVGAGAALTAFIALYDGHPPLWLFMLGVAAPIAGFGMVYGNLSALALLPMGHIAGSASSVVSSCSFAIGISLASVIGDAFDGTVLPLFTAFIASALFSAALLALMARRRVLAD